MVRLTANKHPLPFLSFRSGVRRVLLGNLLLFLSIFIFILFFFFRGCNILKE